MCADVDTYAHVGETGPDNVGEGDDDVKQVDVRTVREAVGERNKSMNLSCALALL